jgi:hypothetical protein
VAAIVESATWTGWLFCTAVLFVALYSLADEHDVLPPDIAAGWIAIPTLLPVVGPIVDRSLRHTERRLANSNASRM